MSILEIKPEEIHEVCARIENKYSDVLYTTDRHTALNLPFPPPQGDVLNFNFIYGQPLVVRNDVYNLALEIAYQQEENPERKIVYFSVNSDKVKALLPFSKLVYYGYKMGVVTDAYSSLYSLFHKFERERLHSLGLPTTNNKKKK